MSPEPHWAGHRDPDEDGATGGVRVASVTVSPTELLALPTPVEIIPAPGPGLLTVPLSFNVSTSGGGGPVFAYLYGGTPYIVNADAYLVLYPADADPGTVYFTYTPQTGLLDQNADKIGSPLPPSFSTPTANKAVLLTATGTGVTPADGNGDLIVNVPYYVAAVG